MWGLRMNGALLLSPHYAFMAWTVATLFYVLMAHQVTAYLKHEQYTSYTGHWCNLGKGPAGENNPTLCFLPKNILLATDLKGSK